MKKRLEERSPQCEEWLREHEAVGEYCLVLADDEQKLSREAEENGWWQRASLEQHVVHYEEQGEDRKEAIKRAARTEGSPSEMYIMKS